MWRTHYRVPVYFPSQVVQVMTSNRSSAQPIAHQIDEYLHGDSQQG